MRKVIPVALMVLLILFTLYSIGIAETNTFTVCFFGSYEQDGNLSNGKEPIEWIVLKEEGDNCYLISRYILSLQLYNVEKEDVTWETCSLRKWLNNEFLNDAFTKMEQTGLLHVVTENGNSGAVKDQVFCLSAAEAESIFDTAQDRIAYTSPIVQNDPNYTNDQRAGVWWLRSRSKYNGTIRTAQDVFSNGSIGLDNIRCRTVGVRPVICIRKAIVEPTFSAITRSELFTEPSITEVEVSSTEGQTIHVKSLGFTITCPLPWLALTRDMSDSQLEVYGITKERVNQLLEENGIEFSAIDLSSFAELDVYTYPAVSGITLKEKSDMFIYSFAASFIEARQKSYGVEFASYDVYHTKNNVYVRYTWQSGTNDNPMHVITYFTTTKGLSYEFDFIYHKEFTSEALFSISEKTKDQISP